MTTAGGLAVFSLAGCSSTDDTAAGTSAEGDDAAAATATDGETATAGASTDGGETFEIGLDSKLSGLDPYLTDSATAWEVIYNVCETLVTFDADGQLVGRLAADWSVDGSTYTFRLREGVQFHPPVSRELVADDVVYSFDRMRADESGLKGDLSNLATVEATGDYEVRMELDGTFAPFAAFLGRVPWVIVPREAVEEQGGAIGDFQRPVGTGPFRIESYTPGEELRLAAFEEYRDSGVPAESRLRLRPVPDADSRVAALRSGDVDVAPIPGKDAGTIASGAETRTFEQSATTWAQVHINCSQPPWDDPAVRRAVAHVVDRSAIVEAGASGYGSAAWQAYPEGEFWHADLSESRRERDVDAARRILADAGDPLANETLSIKTNASFPIMSTTAELLVANLRAAGIDAEVNSIEWGTQLNDFLEGNFGAMAFSVPYKIDPDRHVFGFLHPSGTQFNNYGEEQPDASRMYDLTMRGRTTTDREERRSIYAELWRLINRNVPWISVGLTDTILGANAAVSGYEGWTLPYTRYWTLSE